MDPKVKAIVDALTPEQRERIELLDTLRAGLRIEAAGVDITALPALPPELRKQPALPKRRQSRKG